jgi:hypothetical protein
MAMELTPTTELEAVNEMLGTIGESPISDLETVGNLDASTARDTLRAVCREVQSKGWWFNEFSSYTFTLNADGKAVVPAAILSVRPVIGGARYFARDGFLITAPQGVDTYTDAPVADVIFKYDFTSLPESARRYIAIRAARIFQTKVLGSDQLNVFSKDHEDEAYGVFADEQYDFTRAERINFMSGSQDVNSIWNPTG